MGQVALDFPLLQLASSLSSHKLWTPDSSKVFLFFGKKTWGLWRWQRLDTRRVGFGYEASGVISYCQGKDEALWVGKRLFLGDSESEGYRAEKPGMKFMFN